MALKPLDPAPKEVLSNGWEILASEAGRSNRGARGTVTLLNGTAQASRTLYLGDAGEQQAIGKAFARLAQVKATEVVTALASLGYAVEGVLRQMAAQDTEEHQSQGTRLVALALDAGAELFHTPGADGDAYATIDVEGHKETWPLKVKGFRRWLARLFYEEQEKSPGAQAIQDALGVLEGKALYDGAELPVYTRLAESNGAIYLDLANEDWHAVEITAHGWRVVGTPPVKFRRARGMLPLPAPVPGGSLVALRPFVNLASDEDWRLLVSWLLAVHRPVGPYPVLVIYGEQGSAKSSLVRVLRALVDPNTAALRTTPRDERDLVIAATNSWLIALDNLSHLPDWLSDALCRLATGSGFATRELYKQHLDNLRRKDSLRGAETTEVSVRLGKYSASHFEGSAYTDADEVIFAAQRPVVMNGIEEVATRGDLLDRALILYLPTIPEDKRQDEKAFGAPLSRPVPSSWAPCSTW